jgi:hypothetical protein
MYQFLDEMDMWSSIEKNLKEMQVLETSSFQTMNSPHPLGISGHGLSFNP